MDTRVTSAATAPPAVAPIAPAGPGPGAKAVSSADKPSGAGVPQVEPAQERSIATPPPRLHADVRIELDKAAVRMVQTFVNPETGEELTQFPYENQLAFSRAVVAFERARDATRDET